MLNVESGDYGTLEERDCGCPWGELGLRTHVSGLRSYDKLTSEGVTFMGSILFDILENVLPARFGGGPTDYQFSEEEQDGLPRVSIIASPRLGQLDEPAVIETVLQALRTSQEGGSLMAAHWRQGNTLHVLRREPYTTGSQKVQPLHVQPPVTSNR